MMYEYQLEKLIPIYLNLCRTTFRLQDWF